MNRILLIITICLLALGYKVHAQVDRIISVSGEVGDMSSALDFIDEAGNITHFPRLTDAGEMLYYAPLVSTDSINSISTTSASIYGNILFNGWNTSVLQQGFQYCTDTNLVNNLQTIQVQPENPYIDCENPCVNNMFHADLTSLAPATRYFIRTFAKNNNGTGYGHWISFNTKEEITGFQCGSDLVDVRGDETNVYKTVAIGTQCWMAENLKTKKKPNGDNLSSGYREYTDTKYGLGYNVYYQWTTGTQQTDIRQSDENAKVQGLCPEGWYIPAYGDFKTLCKYIDPDVVYNETVPTDCSSKQTITSTHHLCIKLCKPNSNWTLSSGTPEIGTPAWATANDPSDFNTSGFSAIPFGYASSLTGTVYIGPGNQCGLLTSNSASNSTGCGRTFGIKPAQTGVMHEKENYHGWSIRCIKDSTITPVLLPNVTTATVSDIQTNSATCGGNVTSEGNYTVTARGVCWSTSQNPTTSDAHTTDGNGAGAFTSSLTGLSAQTTYYVRAYATYSNGTIYGEQVSFKTANGNVTPISDCGTLIDADNNEYKTVRIGTQCWMAENMRTTKKPDGSAIASSGIFTLTHEGMGKLYYYNWATAVNQTSGNTVIHTSLQGICPEGWHIPCYDDINTLCQTVDPDFKTITTRPSGKSQYTSSNGLSIKLCSPHYWPSCSTPATPGYSNIDSAGFNTTGLSILPTGYKDNSSTVCPGSSHIWTSIGDGATGLCDIFKIPEDATGIVMQNGKSSGSSFFAVRCLKEASAEPTLPSVTTNAASLVGSITATMNGTITSDGNTTITEKGFYYAQNTDALAGTKIVATGSSNNFSTALSNLNPSTTYYYKAYAINGLGTAYGELKTFTTKQPATLATVAISETSELMATSVDITCNVINDGNETVTERGICWSTTVNPTVSNNHKQDDANGVGIYTISLDGLTANTTYYLRAYAINAVGSAYSENVTITTPEGHIPTVTTDNVSKITEKSATVSISITNTGNSYITESGILYDTLHNSSKAAVILSTTGGNHFDIHLTGLKPSKTYYVKAFATNDIGTGYGEELSFTTDDIFECGKEMKDNDNNTYHTLQIGKQCWMKENLRSKTYADGTSIAQGNSSSSTAAYWYYPGSNASNESEYGLLYNWKAAIHNAATSIVNPNSIQGVCPTGWHVPSGSDWNELIKYFNSHNDYICDASNINIAKALASTAGWQNDTQNCTPGNNMVSNNASGFGAKPAGLYDNVSNQTTYFGQTASFWGADNNTTETETRFYMSYQAAIPFLQSHAKEGAMSVRCLQDRIDSARVLPTVVTNPVSEITAHTATAGGNVLNDAENAVTSKGICYSTQHNPTLEDTHSAEDDGQGIFVSHLSNLEQATTYYVRAYAINGAGISYGNEVVFMTSNPNDGNACAEAAVIYDNDGNAYETVQIGAQCWMKSNLRTTTYSDGSPIALGSKNSQTKAYRYTTSNLNTYGYLYNWKAVMREEKSSNTIPSYVQGICPLGWHVPSRAEWTQLTDYVNSQSKYRYNQKDRAIAKALASTSNWSSYSQAGSVGSSPNNNNATGLNIQPAGAFFWSQTATQKIAALWSSTEAENGNAYYRYLQFFYGYVGDESHDVANGFSVRCLKDDESLILLEVTTAAETNITDDSAVCGGEIIFDGDASAIIRGVCWSTSSTPTVYDAHTTDGSSAGNFISSITDLTGSTTYYVRAYASLGNHTVYGEARSFTTLPSDHLQPCPGMKTVSDRDGNEYNTIQVGEQCWMKENMRTTKYADGTSIAQGTEASTTLAYWHYPNDNSENKASYGLLYNWTAAMNNALNSCSLNRIQGICPIGWHIPTQSDWGTLVDYLNDANLFDAAGFNAMPAGTYNQATSHAADFGQVASFWKADEANTETGFKVSYPSSAMIMQTYSKADALSVRCLRDSVAEEAALASPVTFDVDNVTSTSVTVGGNVYDDGESDVIMKGICYSTQAHPTIEDNFTVDGCGLGRYVAHLSGLEPGTTYFVRAYAVNSAGVSYGDELIFMTYNPNDGSSCASVSDRDGNSYATVHIGGQCWMAEHLRTTTYSDGTPITAGTALSDEVAYRYTPSNSNTYGYLYNWKAVMRYNESSNNVPSGVQGICPAGWHVPSQAEWTLFSDYVNSQSQYRYNGRTRAIAKAVASTINWDSYSAGGSVGSGPSSNNATGFNIMPAGAHYGSTTASGKISALWSSTSLENGEAYSRYLMFYYGYMGAENHNVVNGFSVRCIKN